MRLSGLVFPFGFGGTWVATAALLGAAEPTPSRLPLLMTESGRNYEDVQILKLDPEGPVFRHRHGMAKIPYGQIKAKTRSLLGYPQKTKSEPAARKAVEAKASEKKEAAVAGALTLVPVRITTTWWRMNPRPAPPVWPTINPFQATAAIDFLVTAGWSPHPIGFGSDGYPGLGWGGPDVRGGCGYGLGWR